MWALWHQSNIGDMRRKELGKETKLKFIKEKIEQWQQRMINGIKLIDS